MYLLLLVLFVAVTAGVTAVSSNVFLGLIAGWFADLGAALAILRLATARHRRLMREWADERRLADVTFQSPQGVMIDPAAMPWWMAWAYYELQAVDGQGNRLRFHVFITGAVGCLFRLRMTVTTD